jgi:NADH:ubiquinone oxidoreductase subunit
MHHRTDEVPGSYDRREWEKTHQPNLTGTAGAYRPPGSVLHARPRVQGKDTTYEPWRP